MKFYELEEGKKYKIKLCNESHERSITTYIIENHIIKCAIDDSFSPTVLSYNTIVSAEFTEIKEVKKFNEKEKALLKLIPAGFKYVAVEMSGEASIFQEKPVRNYTLGRWVKKDSSIYNTFGYPLHKILFGHIFTTLTWADEPYLISDIIN